jgi:L-serine dehydratase
MDSVFEIIGPPMIGPSSSHTAGAVRIGLMARRLLGSQPVSAKIGLHGSFAATGQGHATDKGLVSGLLGFAPDDDRLKSALEIAKDSRFQVSFQKVDLGDQVHPNSAKVEVCDQSGEYVALIAASVGGGSIEVVQINGFPASINGTLETLAIFHIDQPGFLAKVTVILACVDANIATIRTSRQYRGENALTLVEVDAPIPDAAITILKEIKSVSRLRVLNRLP